MKGPVYVKHIYPFMLYYGIYLVICLKTALTRRGIRGLFIT